MGEHSEPELRPGAPASGSGRPVDMPNDLDPVPEPQPEPDPGPIDPRPEPVLNAATVAGAISAVILAIGGLLKLAGVLIPADYDLQGLADDASNAILSVGAVWSLFGPWITARIKARDQVTPLADPRDARGRRLLPREER
jgi:hypothetical protein